MSTNNITWDRGLSRAERASLSNQNGLTIWLTGLSGSGKSTIATALERYLLQKGKIAYRLDGDNVRLGLDKDLGFSKKDRNENMRRISEVAKLFADSTTIAIVSFISPYKSERQFAREMHRAAGLPFVEVYVDVPLEVAEHRDPKGLYKKARAGEVSEFTGISAPYEEPASPEIHLLNDQLSVKDAVEQIYEYLKTHKLL